jgi:hypothetical protein
MDDASRTSVIDRRQFLARLGVLGAATTVIGAGTALAMPPPNDPLDDIEQLLQALARDTMGGLAAFCVPGPDGYSLTQGVSTAEPGGVDAGGIDFMLSALDTFFPMHDEALTPIVQSLATGLSDGARGYGYVLPERLLHVPVAVVRSLDDLLSPVLSNDITMPLSGLIALFLNTMASWVDPASLAGPYFGSPFANLDYAGKVEVFRRMEEDTPAVAAALDSNLPEPLRNSLSGLIAFVAGALCEFMSFGIYNEWAALGPDRQLTSVPVGWQLTGYLASTGYQPVEGWNEFTGYYQGRRSAEG